MSSARRVALIGFGGVLLWYLCTTVFWAIQPLTDHVPVGIDQTRKNPQEISVRVECNTLFRSAARGDAPLPTLTAQPKRDPPIPPLAYAYEPCARDAQGGASTVRVRHARSRRRPFPCCVARGAPFRGSGSSIETAAPIGFTQRPLRGELSWCVVVSRDVAIPRLRRALGAPCTTTRSAGCPAKPLFRSIQPC